jgi:hypothetical protein
MIPLLRWLDERSGHPETGLSALQPLHDVPYTGAISAEAPEENAILPPDREAELAMALQQAEERLIQLGQSHMCREKELRSQLGAELSERLALDIARSFQDLLDVIEDSLTQVLTPFLSDAARSKATSDLIEMIKRELSDIEGPVLEIKAPSELQVVLSGLSSEAGISVMMSESDTVEIILAGQRLRFAELSASWCAAIQGREP